jgi:hypothetical protein
VAYHVLLTERKQEEGKIAGERRLGRAILTVFLKDPVSLIKFFVLVWPAATNFFLFFF